jgi:membrane protease YdiL (CAAX protease family)
MKQERYGGHSGSVNKTSAGGRAHCDLWLRSKGDLISWTAMHWDYALLLMLLGLVVPLVGRWRVHRILRGPDPKQADRLRLYASTIAFQWIVVALIIWRCGVHGMSTSELGLAAPRPILVAFVSVGLVTLVLANQFISLGQLGKRPEDLRGNLAQVALRIFPRDNMERLIFVGVVSTVAICEELMYRGFVQALLLNLSGAVAVGILGAGVLFGWAHFYQGKRGVIATCIVGILFSGVRAWTGSLIPVVAAHFAMDLIAGYLFPRALRLELDRLSENVGTST